jgi:mannose-1-phosphate guanylyltransferase/mannose-6-phosphate isomerase
VKDVVDMLSAEGRREASEHTTTYRPWGSYTVLEDGPRYKIKRIVVNRGERLSLQMHYHRSEHWVVIKGAAKVQIGDIEKHVHENESVYIPKSTLHRLENPGKVPLEIIEVQNGEYVEEDDIVRVSDQYGRHQ